MALSIVETHPEKQKIIDQLLAGRSVRAVARSVSPTLDFNAIQRYKLNIIKPAIERATAGERILMGEGHRKEAVVAIQPDSPAIQEARQSIQDAPVLSVFRQRLEKLHGRIDRTLDKAEAAVRISRDSEGNEVFAGPDLAVMAPLLNVAHKNVEILGRATGELEPTGGSGVSIQIVCPTAPIEAMPRITYAAPDGQGQIEGEGLYSDIGLLQK